MVLYGKLLETDRFWCGCLLATQAASSALNATAALPAAYSTSMHQQTSTPTPAYRRRPEPAAQRGRQHSPQPGSLARARRCGQGAHHSRRSARPAGQPRLVCHRRGGVRRPHSRGGPAGRGRSSAGPARLPGMDGMPLGGRQWPHPHCAAAGSQGRQAGCAWRSRRNSHFRGRARRPRRGRLSACFGWR